MCMSVMGGHLHTPGLDQRVNTNTCVGRRTHPLTCFNLCSSSVYNAFSCTSVHVDALVSILGHKTANRATKFGSLNDYADHCRVQHLVSSELVPRFVVRAVGPEHLFNKQKLEQGSLDHRAQPNSRVSVYDARSLCSAPLDEHTELNSIGQCASCVCLVCVLWKFAFVTAC